MIDLFALLEKYHLFFLFIQVIMCVNWSVYRARMRYAYKKTTQMPSGLWVFLFFFVPPEWFMGQRFGFYVDAHVGSKSLHAHRFRFKITTRHWNNTDRKHFDLNAFGFVYRWNIINNLIAVALKRSHFSLAPVQTERLITNQMRPFLSSNNVFFGSILHAPCNFRTETKLN